jgi:UDP-N-acetylmuramyl pentapeptide phosphotransferase/UDP-N-acetylglucosamine-1-phosphate transferase
MTFCMMGVGSAVGFMLLNFPFGKIFMGDGGAYLLGFWLAECAVLLLARNPDVSTWTVLLSCLYPVWETAFSMYRRNIVRKVSSGKPDMVHWHHLMLRRFVGQRLHVNRPAWIRHALTSGSAWALVAGCQITAMLSLTHELWLALGFALFILLYQTSYASIVRGCQPVRQGAEPEMQAS